MTEAATDAFSAGVADTMLVTAVIGLVATAIVWAVWPRKASNRPVA